MKIEKAKEFAKNKHNGQVDDSGKNYFNVHIEQVVSILQCITEDEDIISAGYLHDTIEDTQTTKEELVIEFGERVASLVLEVTHEGDKTLGYYFPRLLSRDAILIKFADRLSNLSRMEAWSDKRKNHYLSRSKFWNHERIRSR